MPVTFEVLGPTAARDEAGTTIALRGPMHRALLARLIVARGRVVPLSVLIEDLWHRPSPGPVGTLRTFVGDLRRVLEPERPPRAPARLLVTDGAGYALRVGADGVDAWRFERAVDGARTATADAALQTLTRAFAWWRGPAFADVVDEHWARTEHVRLTERRLDAVELRAGARLELGRAAEAIPDLTAHVAGHPWREQGWRLLALALYRSARQGEALEVLRRARALLDEQLGVPPGPALARLQTDILRRAPHLDVDSGRAATPVQLWAQTAATYDRAAVSAPRARLRSTVDLLRSLAVTGGDGLEAAQRQRLATILAAQELGDDELTARVIGGYDVPAIWSRADDPGRAARIVGCAERALAALPPESPDAVRARLLATIAVESRGSTGVRGRQAAAQAEHLARRLNDPALLAFALNGVFMQSFHRAGLAARRDAIGVELIELSARHGLSTHQLLGQLICLQARSALGDVAGADAHATAADALAQRYESPLVGVFTDGYRALRVAMCDHDPSVAEAAYRKALSRLDGAGMPGLRRGLLPLALLGLRLLRQQAPDDRDWDWGPDAPWVRPLILLARDRREEAGAALRRLPDPSHDHLLEVRWCLAARAAIDLGDRGSMQRAFDALSPAAAEIAGAGSGLLTLGPVADHLRELAAALATSNRGAVR